MEQDDNRCIPGKGPYKGQPVLGILILGTFSAGQQDQVERPLCHEEAVRPMHDFLTTEIPNVSADRFSFEHYRPLRDLDPGSTSECLVLMIDKSMNQRCLAHTTTAYE